METDMKARTSLILVIAAGVSLAGCDRVKSLIGRKPTGQVVATVNGEEITQLELRSELGGFASRDPKVMKAAQQQALQSIIMRRLVAQEARRQKLDKTPDYSIQKTRAEETLLARTLERKYVEGLPPPTKRDADNFVVNHPDQFANRRIISLDQVIAPANKVDTKNLEALKTLDDVKKVLQESNTPYQQTQGTLDTLSAPPAMIAAITKLPPGEVFVFPQGGALIFSRIIGQRTEPFTGDLASGFAMRVLAQQAQREAVSKRLDALRKAADSKIVYAANYKPAPPSAAPAKGAKPATPAAAAPSAAPAEPAAPATK
jgi:EpsD family peptidyl-prolyl cis-trans isomerase